MQPKIASAAQRLPPDISIITPTYNERENLRTLVASIASAMGSTRWELIVVDDDSPDGTYQEAQNIAREGFPVRCIRRIGRRGLASAVVEGALVSHAEYLAVIDADMQHDERLLPRMLELLATTDCDVVIGSRHVAGGSIGDWAATRQRISRVATRFSRALIGSEVTDPMSGFFAIRSTVFYASIYNLSQQGYKILLDVLASSPTTLQVVELPYVFRGRVSGESKFDVLIVFEFIFLLIEKLTKGLLPAKLALFCLVGGIGLLFHFAVLNVMRLGGFAFLPAQAVATLCAMTLNYFVNNSITYRSQRLRGLNFLIGYPVFCLVCSVGALANIGVANLALKGDGSWTLAGLAGAIMGAVFNFGVATQFIWGRRRR